jgi:CRISPR system Cascade subunit CasC
MAEFVQLHLLTHYPPSNLNRDDLGRPKTAKMGGVDRLRISSQSLKRAWRTSDHFATSMAGNIGTRTKRLGIAVYEKLLDKGVKEKDAKKWAKSIAEQFGKCKKADKNDPLEELEIEQLVHVCPEELAGIDQLIDKLAAESRAPTESELDLLRKNMKAVDIALFGRMLASNPSYNVEAAAQVAHAISVNKTVVEDDYFTAVDDLNDKSEDAGSAHIGEAGFASGVFYLYVCINKDQLRKNLGDDDLAAKAIESLVDAAVQIAPSGKQNSFASRARASYVLVEKGQQQPRSLSVAFLEPIKEGNQVKFAVAALQKQVENMDKVYGPCAESRYAMNVEQGEGTLTDLLSFVSS